MDDAASIPRIRLALPSDADTIATIWHAGASLPGVGPAALPPRRELRSMVDAVLVGAATVNVAERAGRVVGFSMMRPDEATLDQLFVRLDAFGGGVGRALLCEAKRAMPKGFSLFTRPANARACRFYEASGLSRLHAARHPRFGDEIVFYGWDPASAAPCASDQNPA